MVPSGVRTGRWVAAARAAQRRPRVDSLGQPPSPESASTRAALYVHWPYCEKRCSYCNFNKYIPRGVEEGTVRNCLVTEARTLLRLSGVQSPWMTRSCSCWAGLTQPATLYGLWRKPGSFSLAECRWI